MDIIAVGGIVGFGLATVLLQHTVTKLFTSLDSALSKIEVISNNLAVVTTELEYLKKSSDCIVELQRDVAILKSQAFGQSDYN